MVCTLGAQKFNLLHKMKLKTQSEIVYNLLNQLFYGGRLLFQWSPKNDYSILIMLVL
jgi:hypothetical protein